MLSPLLLDLLRDWYRIARPRACLVSGRDPLQSLTTRQLAPVMPLPTWPRSPSG
jgi:hypothetical protein